MTAREFAEAVGSAVFRRMGRAASRFQEESPMPVDVLESGDEYLVVFDAPGATTSDVQVNYEGSEVRVRVDRFREHREGFDVLFPGRGLSLDGSAKLPQDAVVDAEHARAELRDDGTLYVFLPKRERDGTVIEVTSGEDGEPAGDGSDAAGTESGQPADGDE
ncbi:MAG: Hsp20/alpha crystallin family protein [Halobacterium sp.]